MRAGSVRVEDRNDTRRAAGLTGGVLSSVSFSAVVWIVTYGSVVVVLVVVVVVVTVGPPHPNGSFVSSMPSGRTPKRGRGQPSSRAPTNEARASA